MIVWLASYPRSGNTFLRVVLNRLYDAPTYVVYDEDGVVPHVGRELIGASDRPVELEEMAAAEEVYFVKTHRQRSDDSPAICLVRDGRDALVSWARLHQHENAGDTFEERLREQLLRLDTTGTGSWGRNVLSWLRPPAPHRVVVHYADLVRDPTSTVRDAVAALVPDLKAHEDVEIPSFAELQQVNGAFFRRGATGSHKDELPDKLHDLFWAQQDNAEAMALLGLAR